MGGDKSGGDYGYAGKIAKVDLTSRRVSDASTSDYAERFLGGRGIAAKIHWDDGSPRAKSLEPESTLVFSIGPLAGFAGLAGSNWEVSGKSPAVAPEGFAFATGAGSWGTGLKRAGYDAIAIQGASDTPVYLYVSEDGVEIRDAAFLSGKFAIQTREKLQSHLGNGVSVAAIGPAGENLVPKAITLADDDASASGFGAVMGAKKLKAIAVTGDRKPVAARPEKLAELREHLRNLRRGVPRPGVYARPDFRYEDMSKRKKSVCYGCISGCGRTTYRADNGLQGKLACKGTLLYYRWAKQYYGDAVGDVPFLATYLCNQYGIDLDMIDTMIRWLARCYAAGVLSETQAELPLSKIGSIEFVSMLIRQVALREGFGDILAEGVFKAAQSLGQAAKDMLDDGMCSRTGDSYYYDPRLYVTTGVLYATEPRPTMAPLHEVVFPIFRWEDWVNGSPGAYLSNDDLKHIAKRYFGGEQALDFSTYEGKALAAKTIQDREYVKASLILCDLSWPVIDTKTTEDHMGDPTAESKAVSAITGKELDEQALYEIGDRVFNLCRAIRVREGHRGRQDDSLQETAFTVPISQCTFEYHEFANPRRILPGKNGEVLMQPDAVLDRGGFEGVKDDYYRLRGWDVATGLQTARQLNEMGLADIARGLTKGQVAE